MRGYLQPGIKAAPSEAQTRFSALSRHRRTKLAKAANTTLLKADQWARGGSSATDVDAALLSALGSLKPKK